MTQLAYCYNADGYYTHTEYCTVDPLESATQGHDVFVLPANACLDAPVIAKGCVAQRVNGAWVNVENHVGEEGYVNGIAKKIEEYGPLPDGWSTSIPEPSAREKILCEICDLEAQQTPRRLREAALSDEGKAWLQNLEHQIASKRMQLAEI